MMSLPHARLSAWMVVEPIASPVGIDLTGVKSTLGFLLVSQRFGLRRTQCR